MPLKLLIFAPCEKVIVGEEDHLTSMIGILERVTVQILEDLPSDAVLPMKWSAVTLWRRDGDYAEPKSYEQRVQILRPDGTEGGGGQLPFDVTNSHNNFRNVMHVPALPVGVQGVCTLKLALREAGQGDWSEVAEYPLEIAHEVVKRDEISNS